MRRAASKLLALLLELLLGTEYVALICDPWRLKLAAPLEFSTIILRTNKLF